MNAVAIVKISGNRITAQQRQWQRQQQPNRMHRTNQMSTFDMGSPEWNII